MTDDPLIDNYDSFSYNLVQMIGTINPDIRVIRNDEMTVEEIAALQLPTSSSHRDPDTQKMQAYVKPSFRDCRAEFPFWGSAWDIRQSVRCMVPGSAMPDI